MAAISLDIPQPNCRMVIGFPARSAAGSWSYWYLTLILSCPNSEILTTGISEPSVSSLHSQENWSLQVCYHLLPSGGTSSNTPASLLGCSVAEWQCFYLEPLAAKLLIRGSIPITVQLPLPALSPGPVKTLHSCPTVALKTLNTAAEGFWGTPKGIHANQRNTRKLS